MMRPLSTGNLSAPVQTPSISWKTMRTLLGTVSITHAWVMAVDHNILHSSLSHQWSSHPNSLPLSRVISKSCAMVWSLPVLPVLHSGPLGCRHSKILFDPHTLQSVSCFHHLGLWFLSSALLTLKAQLHWEASPSPDEPLRDFLLAPVVPLS